jgi:hypothetical protein
MVAVPGMAASHVQPKCRCLTWECHWYGGTLTTSRTRVTTVGSQFSVWHASELRSMTRRCSALSTVRLLTSPFLMCWSCKYWMSFTVCTHWNLLSHDSVHGTPETIYQDCRIAVNCTADRMKWRLFYWLSGTYCYCSCLTPGFVQYISLTLDLISSIVHSMVLIPRSSYATYLPSLTYPSVLCSSFGFPHFHFILNNNFPGFSVVVQLVTVL